MYDIALAGRGPGLQRGAALVIGLVLLMVLTVLGVTGMNSSILDLRMTDNAQQAQHAFQAAESTVDTALATIGPVAVDDTLDSGDVVDTLDYSYAPGGYELATATATTVFRTMASMAPGGGWEAGSMTAVHFQIDSDASAGRGARSAQRAGFYIMAPAP